MTSHSATISHTRHGHGPSHTRHGHGPVLRGLLAIVEFFDDLRRASEAAAYYRRLSSLSDSALARRGLKRDSLPRAAYEMAFGGSR